MFNLKLETSNDRSEEINALLGKGSEFDGKLVFEGNVRIDGKFKGEIISQGKLVIAEGAQVSAEIKVDAVVISGNVNGNIIAKGRVELHTPAKLVGNIQAGSLVIDEGVTFDGNCKMTKHEEESNTIKETPIINNEIEHNPDLPVFERFEKKFHKK